MEVLVAMVPDLALKVGALYAVVRLRAPPATALLAANLLLSTAFSPLLPPLRR